MNPSGHWGQWQGVERRVRNLGSFPIPASFPCSCVNGGQTSLMVAVIKGKVGCSWAAQTKGGTMGTLSRGRDRGWQFTFLELLRMPG